jgi:hypothetical protein
LPVSVQTGEPLEQEIDASLQTEPVQLAPWLHATHEPPEQTMLVPQLAPFESVPVAVHTGEPVEQATLPVWQALPPGMQLAPTVHAVQTPPDEQTMLVPQLVPAETGVPVSLQVAPPTPQLSMPTWHAFDGVQAEPAVQVTHAPLLQIMPPPQAVPSG